MANRPERDLSDDEFDEVMNQAGVRGFWLFMLSVFTIGIGPAILLSLKDRKERNAEQT